MLGYVFRYSKQTKAPAIKAAINVIDEPSEEPVNKTIDGIEMAIATAIARKIAPMTDKIMFATLIDRAEWMRCPNLSRSSASFWPQYCIHRYLLTIPKIIFNYFCCALSTNCDVKDAVSGVIFDQNQYHAGAVYMFAFPNGSVMYFGYP